MAVQITSDNFEQYFLRTQEQFADALEQAEGARGCEVVTDIETIKQVLSLPGVKYSADPITTPTATAQAYVQIPYSILAQALQEMREATEDATEAAGSVETAITNAEAATSAANTAAQSADTSRQQMEANESTRQSNESTRQSNESTRQSQESTRQSNEQSRTTTFSSDHSRAESDHSTAASDHTTASSDHTQAVSDHTKVAGAENLNAQLLGMTVSITNRQGVTSSVDIGFEMYRTYTSVAAMNADAANVPQGKFVMIATTDPTSADNAKLYCKNSQGSFTFLSDLDQASAAAWADWLENMKPAINERIATADSDHSRAETDHSTASTDHSTASSDHSQAQSDHTQSVNQSAYAKTQGDYAKDLNEHPGYIADGTAAHPGDAGYYYTWDYENQQYVRGALLSLDWASMTDAQKEALAADVLAAIGFDDVPVHGSQNAVKSGGIYDTFEEERLKPVDISSYTYGQTFQKNSLLVVDGVVYITTADTENLPFVPVVQDGKILTQTIEGFTTFVRANNNLPTGWKVWLDCSNSLRMTLLEKRIATIETRLGIQ